MPIRLAMSAFLCAMLAWLPAYAAQQITEYHLENGLQIVVIEDHRAPAVSQQLWYRVGSADEPRGKSGIAHFVEHLMFHGTETVGPRVFSNKIRDLGGTENAFTSYDYTSYFQRVAAEHLGVMMELEADRMRNLKLDDQAIETERRIVLEERNQRTDTSPDGLFREQRAAALYLNHPYGVPIIGWRHEIEALSRSDIFEFYRKHYAPNNAVLVVAGDVDPEEVLRLAELHYGPIKASEELSERVRPSEPPHLAPRRLVFRDQRVAQPYMVRSYLAEERNSGDQSTAAALEMFAEVLSGDGINSYLSKKLEVEERVAVHAAAYYSGTSFDPSSFSFVVVPAPNISMEEAEAALDRALEEFVEAGVDIEQLDRLKTASRAALIYEQDKVENLARRYGRALTAGLTVADIALWPDELQTVTPDDIIAAAEELLQLENSVTGWILPEEDPA